MKLKRSSRGYLIWEVKSVLEGEDLLGYARVSTADQAVNSHALEQQMARLIEHGATLIIADVQSGKRDDRKGLEEVMRRVQNKTVSGVIVTRLDRLGRRVPTIRNNIQTFQETGINLKVIDQQIDLSGPYGMFMINLLASLAEMEVDQLAERVKHGKEHRRKQHLACECIPFGYVATDDRYCLDRTPFLCLLEDRPDNYRELAELDDVTQLPGITVAELARDCVETFLLVKGLTPAVRAIATKYGIGHSTTKKNGNDKIFHWTATGLRKWLQNPILRGHTAYHKRIKAANGQRKAVSPDKWTIIKDTHPSDRLISDEEFARIEELLAFNASRYGYGLYNYDRDNPNSYSDYAYLRGLVYCAECGSKCYSKARVSKDGNTKYHYFACRFGRQGCSNFKGTRKELIEQTLISTLLQQSTAMQSAPPTSSEPAPKPLKSPKRQELEDRLGKLEAIAGFDPDIEALKQKTRQQLQEETNPFVYNALDTKTAEEIVQAGNNLLIWYTLSTDEKVEVYKKIVQRITVYGNEVRSVVLKTAQSKPANS